MLEPPPDEHGQRKRQHRHAGDAGESVAAVAPSSYGDREEGLSHSHDGSQRRDMARDESGCFGSSADLVGTIQASIQPHVGQPVTGWDAVCGAPICQRRGKIRPIGHRGRRCRPGQPSTGIRGQDSAGGDGNATDSGLMWRISGRRRKTATSVVSLLAALRGAHPRFAAGARFALIPGDFHHTRVIRAAPRPDGAIR